MHRRRLRGSPWLWFAFVAFLATRVSDAHVHLCFDGQEPPAAVHMADGSVHNDAHHGNTDHTDQDVDVLAALLVKKVGESSDGHAVLPVLATAILVADEQGARPACIYRPPPTRTRLRLKPPLRGPPL